MVIIAIVVLLLLVSQGIQLVKDSKEFSDRRLVGGTFIVVPGVTLFVIAVTILVTHMNAYKKMGDLEAIRTNVEYVLLLDDEDEMARLQKEIIKINHWLIRLQYLRTETPFRIWYPKKIDDLEPI